MPGSRGRPSAKADPTSAFLNIPFDQQFESLYLAFIAGLSGFGLIPQAVLQIPGSQRQPRPAPNPDYLALVGHAVAQSTAAVLAKFGHIESTSDWRVDVANA